MLMIMNKMQIKCESAQWTSFRLPMRNKCGIHWIHFLKIEPQTLRRVLCFEVSKQTYRTHPTMRPCLFFTLKRQQSKNLHRVMDWMCEGMWLYLTQLQCPEIVSSITRSILGRPCKVTIDGGVHWKLAVLDINYIDA